jgi:hypothetical protein
MFKIILQADKQKTAQKQKTKAYFAKMVSANKYNNKYNKSITV